MANCCARSFRFFRVVTSPAFVIVTFTFLLTFIFVLYQPTRGPGISQRVGWQSWDHIDPSQSSVGPGDVDSSSDIPSSSESPPPTDWWNVTSPEESLPDTSSFPLDSWAPLLPHDTGLSEIGIERCMFDPRYAEDLCAPQSSVEQDAVKGKWVRVGRDLNMQSGLWFLYIYYRRTRRLDIPLVTDMMLLPSGEEPPSGDSWYKVKRSIRDGVVRTDPLYLWYKTGKTLGEMGTEEKQQIITEIDVLYGEDRPWYGFEKVEPPVTSPKVDMIEGVYVTYRRGVKPVPKAPPLHFSHEGKFKILQVADLHYSVSHGSCRDTDISPCLASDNLTNTLIGRALDAEKPDLVVFTGDQLNGQGTSWDPKSVLAKFAVAVTDRGIPWAAVFGNHDTDMGDIKEEELKLLQHLPYSLVQRGPEDVHGVGNYVLKVRSADQSKTHLLTLYFLDSGSYSKGYFDWLGYFFPTEYDWIHKDQIDWFLKESSSISLIERPFTPNTDADLGGLWQRQDGQIAPTTRKLARPNALMFFHIPLPESYGLPDDDRRTGLPLDIGISGLEESGAAKKSDGMFENGLLRALETDHRGASAIPEVKVVANGHCHITENCKRRNDVWLCFGGGGSYSAYGKVGFDRRFRIYDISDYGETIRTYKRTEHEEIVNEQVLAGAGASPYNLQQ